MESLPATGLFLELLNTFITLEQVTDYRTTVFTKLFVPLSIFIRKKKKKKKKGFEAISSLGPILGPFIPKFLTKI